MSSYFKIDWIKELQNITKRVYSQGNQDGIIEEVFNNIGTTNKYCVEIGYNTNTLGGGSGPNTSRLIIEDEWTGLLLDGYHENKEINLHKEFLTFDNICDVFKKYSVPMEFDYLSIDVDGIDLWLMKAILMGGYKPRLISVEYNPNFTVPHSFVVKKDYNNYIGDMTYGASLTALYSVGEEYGYSLITNNEYDLFFLRDDLVNCEIYPLEYYVDAYRPAHSPTTMSRVKKWLVEYPSYEPITNINHKFFRYEM